MTTSAKAGLCLVEPPGFEPGSRPYEWNEFGCCIVSLSGSLSTCATITPRLRKIGGEYWNRTNHLRFAVHILIQNTGASP